MELPFGDKSESRVVSATTESGYFGAIDQTKMTMMMMTMTTATTTALRKEGKCISLINMSYVSTIFFPCLTHLIHAHLAYTTRSVYVHQLQATNGMIHAYQTKTLPKLLEVSGGVRGKFGLKSRAKFLRNT